MASKTSLPAALFLAVNLLFFAVATSTDIHPSLNPKAPELVSSSLHKKCPIDALKLGVCANVLNGLINLNLGKPPKKPCCPLLHGLVDLEAAVCLCTALKADILGLKLNLPVDLNLVLNYCGKKSPKGFKCA